MKIGNFTPDNIKWRYIGVDGVVKSGEIVEYADGQAKHILSHVGAKGLVRLDFGEDLEQRKQDSKDRYREFWEKQITILNQHNDEQKEKGNRFAKPSAELVLHAKRLELELRRPWTVTEAREGQDAKALKSENSDLKNTISAMKAQVDTMMAFMLKDKTTETPEPAPDVKKNRAKYKSLREGTMTGWVKNNWDEIKGMPDENKGEIEKMYQELYDSPYPTEKPE